MARPWSARCYGVARQRDGSRQNSRGVSGVLSLRHFGLVLFIPWRVGAEESGAAKDGFGGAMLLDRLGPPGRCSGCWPHDGEVAGGAVADLGLLISGPRVNLFSHPYAREGADGQAVVCPLLRGRSPTRGVAPKQHRGLGRASLRHFGLARGCRRIWRGVILVYWFRRRDAARPDRSPGRCRPHDGSRWRRRRRFRIY